MQANINITINNCKSICLAATEFDGIDINGGIGTYYKNLALLLSRDGWNVTILYNSPKHLHSNLAIANYADSFYKKYKIRIYDAQKLCNESKNKSYIISKSLLSLNNEILALSHIFDESLKILMNDLNLHFDLIEFSDWLNGAVIPIRSKKNSGEYDKSRIIVKLHSPELWINESNFFASLQPGEIKADFLNRYCFENADIQVSPTNHLLEWCRDHNWLVRDDASICRNPISFSSAYEFAEDLTQRNKIIFFGRLERRKGVCEFIDAIRYIDSVEPNFKHKYSIIFLGKEDIISRKDIIKITNDINGLNLDFLTFEDRDDAIRYLAREARLVVIPSYQDNFPNTILECMYIRIPLLASRGGGIPEIIGIDTKLYQCISCDVTNTKNFGNKILETLCLDEESIVELAKLAYERVLEIANPDDILKWYNKSLQVRKIHERVKNTKSDEQIGVTILIPTMNLTTEKYLETTLNCLLKQTYKDLQIIVNDASTDLSAISKLNYMIKKYCEYDNIKFFHQEHCGIGNALNQVLPYVKTKYVMEVDADNIPMPEMVETFVKSMESYGDNYALSSYHIVFRDDEEVDVIKSLDDPSYMQNFIYNDTYLPIGSCLPLLFFENTVGDANSIYHTETIKQLGGWPEDKRGFQDWALWLKLLANEQQVDVIPKYLYYYRNRMSSDSKYKKLLFVDNNNIRFIRQIMENKPKIINYYLLHKLVRLHYPYGNNFDARPPKVYVMIDRDELVTLKNKLVTKETELVTKETELVTKETELVTKETELRAIKSGALYSLGVRLGDLADKSRIIKMIFQLSGYILKRLCQRR